MYRNILVIDMAMSDETKLMVSQHSVQESKKLMMNGQEGTRNNSMLVLFCVILTV